MWLPIFSHPSTELEGLKDQPKTPSLKPSIKSFLSHLNHLRNYVPAAESRIAVSDISSETYASFPNNGLSNISSETHGSFPNKGVLNISSETCGSFPSKGVSNVSTEETYGSLPKKGVSNISSERYANLPNNGCDSLSIYVYDLPPMFNYDVKNNCTHIQPLHNKCDDNLNDGLGPEAKELAGMLPESVLPALYWTDLFWGELLYHHRMFHYKCRTLDPESATAFFVPFYVSFAVTKYLWGNHSWKERDWHSEMLIKWLQNQKWWKKSNGSDHFIMLGRMTWDFRRWRDIDTDWGTSFLNMPAMQNVIRVSVERSIWDDLKIAVPYPTIFHPRSESDTIEWQSFVRSRHRNHLFTFVGGGRAASKNDFRELLKNRCLNEPTACRHPRGDAFTRRSVFDCMLAGSIPVFFWKRTAYLQYELFMPSEPESYSIFIHRDNVRNGMDIRRVLEGYSREEVQRMREKVIEYIPRFVYAKPSQGLEKTRDAFDIAIDGIFSKYKDHMERGKIENSNET
ncbi:hypothetical protein Vadar_012832 [Vaccinium darrowii]|uniref:Uncharacterized protein n=1 Tax=Vaccinium darrowii TaxID=229202 RepID=A0ACB7XZ23_9ERIC|nr:hypothetical protein Vadar_012832 [Vaccinium darrowii]